MIPILDIWWCLLWVLKPVWAAFVVGRGVCVTCCLRFTSGVKPAELLVASMAAEPFSSTYLWAGIGGAQNQDLLCYHSVWHHAGYWLSYAGSAQWCLIEIWVFTNYKDVNTTLTGASEGAREAPSVQIFTFFMRFSGEIDQNRLGVDDPQPKRNLRYATNNLNVNDYCTWHSKRWVSPSATGSNPAILRR